MSSLRSLARGGLGRCPECGHPGLFCGLFALNELCPRCGVRFERHAGSWTIAPWLAITVGVVVSTTLTALAWTRGWMRPGWEWGMGAAGVLGAVGSYRPIKGATFGMLHAVGLVTVDPVQVGNVVYLDRFRRQRAPPEGGGVAQKAGG